MAPALCAAHDSQFGQVLTHEVRKYYTTTESGLEVLERAKGKIRELVEEVVDNYLEQSA